jgi:hypothetical protein
LELKTTKLTMMMSKRVICVPIGHFDGLLNNVDCVGVINSARLGVTIRIQIPTSIKLQLAKFDCLDRYHIGQKGF